MSSARRSTGNIFHFVEGGFVETADRAVPPIATAPGGRSKTAKLMSGHSPQSSITEF